MTRFPRAASSRTKFKAVLVAASLIAALAIGTPLRAREAAILTVADHPQVRDLARIGVNIEGWTNYGADQFSSNVIMNPGFEPTIDRTIVIVKEVRAEGFADDTPWLARPDGFWTGGSLEVLSGRAAGQTGRISGSTQHGVDGLGWFSTARPTPPLSPGDVISVMRLQSAGPPANWWIQNDSKQLVQIDRSQHPPQVPGNSSVKLRLRGSEPVELISYLTEKRKFLPLDGRWRLSFWTHSVGPGATLSVSFGRIVPPSERIFVSQTSPVSSSWKLITLEFTPRSDDTDGPLKLRFAAMGPPDATVWIANVELGRATDLNHGPWRAETIATLKLLRPGYLRDWQGQLGDTLANRLAPIFARSPQRYSPDPGDEAQSFMYSVPDFLALCREVGAQPWIVAPTTFYGDEFSQLGAFLARAQASYHFREIVVEFGNENWNGAFRAGGISNPSAMAQAANRAFGLLRKSAGSSTPLHLVINGQYANTAPAEQALRMTPAADAVDVAPYFFYTLNSSDSQAKALAEMLTPEDESARLASLRRTVSAIGKAIDVYEVNLSTTDGDASPAQRDQYVAGMISGVSLARRLIEGIYAGALRQVVFNLAQYEYKVRSGGVKLWGITSDLRVSGDFRPTGLAVEMLNRAIAGSFYPATANRAAQGITAAAFLSRSGWSVALVSTNSSAVQLSIQFPGQGMRPSRLLELSAPSIFSQNENDHNVRIEETQLAPSTPELTVPPYGLIVLLPPDDPA